VYGPVRTVVWQGSAGDRGPYADQISITLFDPDGCRTFLGERYRWLQQLTRGE
jgi:hypothetical protein